MARTPAGLTDEQVAALRAALQENKRPKVAVAGQQFGGETTGQVVTVGDPDAEGPEFIQVRVTLDGFTDVLRFAPKELRLPQRGRGAGARQPPAVRAPRRAASAKPVPSPSGDAPVPAAVPSAVVPSAVVPSAVVQSVVVPPPPKPAEVAKPVSAPKRAAAQREPAARSEAGVGAVAAKSAARPRKAAVRPPTITITISSSGTDWSVTANRGGKSVLKAAAIAPGVVAAAVELLGEPAISAAVDEVNGAALSLARQRAEELRAELAAVESVLAAHRAPGR